MRVQIPIVFCIIICVFFTGCTENSSQQVAKPEVPTVLPPAQTAIPTTIPATLATQATPEPQTPASIFDQPLSEPPVDLAVSISVQKDPVYSMITVSFDGGKGQELVQNILVKTTLSTGESVQQPLGKNKGDEIEINGSKGADRVQVAVSFMNGGSYVVTDTELGPNRVDRRTPSPAPEKSMNTSEEGLYPGPVTQPPNSLSVSVDVMKEPIYRVITGTFRGGHGQFLVSRIEMRAVLGSGESVTRLIPNDIGAIGEIQGSDGIDRVQVVVAFKNGEVYKILEKTFGSRG